MKQKILVHAIRLAAKHGFNRITRTQVATSADVAPGLVSYYFESMKGLQTAVLREAVHTENLAVIAQGLIARHQVITHAPAALRIKAAQHLAA